MLRDLERSREPLEPGMAGMYPFQRATKPRPRRLIEPRTDVCPVALILVSSMLCLEQHHYLWRLIRNATRGESNHLLKGTPQRRIPPTDPRGSIMRISKDVNHVRIGTRTPPPGLEVRLQRVPRHGKAVSVTNDPELQVRQRLT